MMINMVLILVIQLVNCISMLYHYPFSHCLCKMVCVDGFLIYSTVQTVQYKVIPVPNY